MVPPWRSRPILTLRSEGARNASMQGISSRKPVVVAVAGLCLLAGCAQYEAKPLSPDQTAAQFEARTLDDLGLRKFIERNRAEARNLSPLRWPLREWDFDTLTL